MGGRGMDCSSPIAIGRLSKKTGISIEAIRYYERVGLLPAPARTNSGYRLYRADHLKRLTFIRRARALGFSLDEIRTLLHLADERKRPCAEVRVLAAAHLKNVRTKIDDLRRMERVLRARVAACADGKRRECPVIEALYRNGSGSTHRGAPDPGTGDHRSQRMLA
jgi:MerR family transcriptional regulator, mercuric resistance operon regulatory protein